MSASLIWWIAVPALIVVSMLALIWFGQKKRQRSDLPATYIEALRALCAGEEEEAFQKFLQVTDEDTENVDAYLKLGDLFRKRKQYERAYQVHKELMLRFGLSDQQMIDIKRSLALDFLEARRYGRAIPFLKEMLEVQKDNRWALENLLRAYEETGQWGEAFKIQEKLLRLDGDRSGKTLAMYKVFEGRRMAESGDYHKARVLYKDAIRLDEKCAAAYLFLGDAYHSDDRLEDAVEAWKKLISKVPSRAPLAFEKLETTLFDLGRYAEVAEIYKRLIGTDDRNTAALEALARIYEKMGNTQSAVETYRRALHVDPKRFVTRKNLIRLYRQTDQVDLALAEMDRLVEDAPEHGEGYVCNACGHKSETMLWRCPDCRGWDSFVAA